MQIFKTMKADISNIFLITIMLNKNISHLKRTYRDKLPLPVLIELQIIETPEAILVPRITTTSKEYPTVLQPKTMPLIRINIIKLQLMGTSNKIAIGHLALIESNTNKRQLQLSKSIFKTANLSKEVSQLKRQDHNQANPQEFQIAPNLNEEVKEEVP